MFLIKNNSERATLKVSIVGGSNSVMRRGYAKYLRNHLSQLTARKTSLDYYALGGVPNVFSLIQEERHNIASKSDIIFFEYCVNDRHAIETNNYSLELAGKSLEGFIQKCQRANPYCLIVLLIFGVNHEEYYQQSCALSEVYEAIGRYYCLPVVNLTTLLSEKNGVDFVKSLYKGDDVAHYTRPYGVKVVAREIAHQLCKIGVVNSLKSEKNAPRGFGTEPVYDNELANLKFFDRFDEANYFDHQPKVSIYQNSVYREQNYTLTPGNALRFLLKGKLAALYIKSDSNDGAIEINFGKQRLVTSSYSAWVNKIKPQNVISLITLPLSRFSPSADFAPVSISCCSTYPEQIELDYVKEEPKKKDPSKWKLSIIGIAYIGEIKPLDYRNSQSLN